MRSQNIQPPPMAAMSQNIMPMMQQQIQPMMANNFQPMMQQVQQIQPLMNASYGVAKKQKMARDIFDDVPQGAMDQYRQQAANNIGF